MYILRTVTLDAREADGPIYVCRMSTTSGGYSNSPYFNDGPSFPDMATAVAHFEKYGYTADYEVADISGMVTMQRAVE